MSEAVVGVDDPILNGPYDPPSQHFVLGPSGPTGEIADGRRPSESFIPVPSPRKGKAGPSQQQLDLTAGERRERNDLINEVRFQVGRWRQQGYPGVTPVSRKLLEHWADPGRENRMLFCQREAAETAIYLAERSGREGPDFRSRLGEENRVHNDGLPRVALKMATGSGKTVVMAMLIAWQTINKVHSPRDSRFTKRFVVVAPGITIRDRLRVLLPSDAENYYRLRDLVPADLWGGLNEAQIVITNYHAFLPRTVKEMQGVAGNTRKILTAGKQVDPFIESPDQIVSRVLRGLPGTSKLGGIMVFNDEAHHCYQDRPLDDPEDLDAEAEERNVDARVWFKGLQAVHRKLGLKAVYDLSATPYYLKGSGYSEGHLFPWTVSDFSLMDAIESGIVKVPRVPVDDDATSHLVTYLRLWDHVGSKLPKRRGKKAGSDAHWVPPDTLEGALRSLYRSYDRSFRQWEQQLEPLGEPPPVMIVVCPNTIVSKLVYDWIGGADVEVAAGADTDPIVHPRSGELPLLANVVDGNWLTRPRTILVDSAQLESGDAMKADFKAAVGHEIETFKSEIRRRNPGADVDNLTDEDLLREVMNTVGKRGKLGEHVRCVVSVSMLTEGWDANTVTHILGIRAFGSQLLCEQVVGRGLRRRSYVLNDEGRFDPEFAEVYGVPFAFIPSDRVPGDPKPSRPAIEVRALDERSHLRIEFPHVEGYRVELPPEPISASFTDESGLHIDKTSIATLTEVQGIVGASELHRLLADVPQVRTQHVAYELARHVIGELDVAHDHAVVHTRFPQIVAVAKEWLTECVTFEPGCTEAMLLHFAELRARAAERIFASIVRLPDARRELLRPILRRYEPIGSTDGVAFFTRKKVIDTDKSHINRVTLDGDDGNTWEQTLVHLLESNTRVHAYAKIDRLGFTIPYLHAGVAHHYYPDFLVRLQPAADDSELTLIIEVSGGRKDQQLRAAKASAAADLWVPAVNSHAGFGRWGYVEISNMSHAASALDEAIERLEAATVNALINT